MNQLVRIKTTISLVGPSIILDFGKEHWMMICIKNDQEYFEVNYVKQGGITITGRAMPRNEILERVAKTVI
jgi:hypothetical protein